MRDSTYLNWKLQDHVDDSLPAAGKVEPFREPDPEGPQEWGWGQDEMGRDTQCTAPASHATYIPTFQQPSRQTCLLVALPKRLVPQGWQVQLGPEAKIN